MYPILPPASAQEVAARERCQVCTEPQEENQLVQNLGGWPAHLGVRAEWALCAGTQQGPSEAFSRPPPPCFCRCDIGALPPWPGGWGGQQAPPHPPLGKNPGPLEGFGSAPTSGPFSVLPSQNKNRGGGPACLSLPVTHLSVWLSSGCLSSRNSGGTPSSSSAFPGEGLERPAGGRQGWVSMHAWGVRVWGCRGACVWGSGVHTSHKLETVGGSLGKTEGQRNR